MSYKTVHKKVEATDVNVHYVCPDCDRWQILTDPPIEVTQGVGHFFDEVHAVGKCSDCGRPIKVELKPL